MAKKRLAMRPMIEAAKQNDDRQSNEVEPIHTFEIDLHGYHPDDICDEPLAVIIRQAWEMGAEHIRLIHGHGHGRGISPGFVNTNTGYFGLRIRDELRNRTALRQWIKYTTLDCGHDGSTVVKLKRNPTPTRDRFDYNALPNSSIQSRRGWR